MKTVPKLLITLLVALVLDGLTKAWAVQTLEPYQPVPVIGEFFRLTLGYNTGVAFSMFTNSGLWPLIITGIIILGLATWSVNALRSGDLPPQAVWSVGLILGGAIANFINRLLEGHVIDFLDFGLGALRWPAFNLADSCIVVGIAWLMVIKMRTAPETTNGDKVTEPNKYEEAGPAE